MHKVYCYLYKSSYYSFELIKINNLNQGWLQFFSKKRSNLQEDKIYLFFFNLHTMKQKYILGRFSSFQAAKKQLLYWKRLKGGVCVWGGGGGGGELSVCVRKCDN